MLDEVNESPAARRRGPRFRAGRPGRITREWRAQLHRLASLRVAPATADAGYTNIRARRIVARDARSVGGWTQLECPGGTMTTLPARAVSTDEWVDRAKSIAPVVEKYRSDSEQQRHMARPIFDAIREIGIIGMCAPRAFGGPQADPLANLRVIEEISRQDGSAGWNTMIWTGTGV